MHIVFYIWSFISFLSLNLYYIYLVFKRVWWMQKWSWYFALFHTIFDISKKWRRTHWWLVLYYSIEHVIKNFIIIYFVC